MATCSKVVPGNRGATNLVVANAAAVAIEAPNILGLLHELEAVQGKPRVDGPHGGAHFFRA